MKKKKTVAISIVTIIIIIVVAIFFLTGKKEEKPQGELFGVVTGSSGRVINEDSIETANGNRTILDIHEAYKDGLGTPLSPPDKGNEPIAEYEYINNVKHYKYASGTPVVGGNARYMTEDERRLAKENGDITMVSYLDDGDYALIGGSILDDMYGDGTYEYLSRICNQIVENEYYNKHRNILQGDINLKVIKYPDRYEGDGENITYIFMEYYSDDGPSRVSLYRIVGNVTSYWVESINKEIAVGLFEKNEYVTNPSFCQAICSTVEEYVSGRLEKKMNFIDAYNGVMTMDVGDIKSYCGYTDEAIEECTNYIEVLS